MSLYKQNIKSVADGCKATRQYLFVVAEWTDSIRGNAIVTKVYWFYYATKSHLHFSSSTPKQIHPTPKFWLGSFTLKLKVITSCVAITFANICSQIYLVAMRGLDFAALTCLHLCKFKIYAMWNWLSFSLIFHKLFCFICANTSKT